MSIREEYDVMSHDEAIGLLNSAFDNKREKILAALLKGDECDAGHILMSEARVLFKDLADGIQDAGGFSDDEHLLADLRDRTNDLRRTAWQLSSTSTTS